MKEIKLIDKDTIIPKASPLDWDLEIKGRPYYVVRLEGFVHTIGGHWGENDYWAYPRDEEPCYENLIEFDSNSPVLWGIEYKPTHYIKRKWGESEVRRGSRLIITRNGKPFDELNCNGIYYGIDKARVRISDYNEHPLDLNSIDFDKKMEERKIWWRSQPAKIERFIWEQACVIIVPDGIEKFETPPEFRDDDWMDDSENNYIKTHILDKHIWWFRD